MSPKDRMENLIQSYLASCKALTHLVQETENFPLDVFERMKLIDDELDSLVEDFTEAK